MKNIKDVTFVSLEDFENFYYETDIEIASTLVVKGFELVSVNKISDTRATFVFKRQGSISDVIDGFWKNTVLVHPLELANARKNLKSRIYSIKTIKY